jgi:hypothetical protein
MLGAMTAAPAGSPARPNAGGDSAVAARGGDGGADPSSIRITTEGPTVVLVVDGSLDAREGETLLRLATAAVDSGPDRLDIDLRGLRDYTEDGARALVACRSLGPRLAEGLHYRTGRGPGREALLLAYQDVETVTSPGSLGDHH